MAPRRASTAALLAALAAAAGLGTCSFGSESAASPAARLAFATLGLELFIGLSAVAAALLSPLPLRLRLALGPGRLPGGWLAAAVVGTLALSHALDTLLAFSGLRDHSALAEVDAALAGADARTLALALLGLALAPGLAEELLCRGWLQRGLIAGLGPRRGIGLAALCFGALHLEWIQGGAACVLGLYLGAVAYLAGSTRASITCHVANNATAVGLAASDLSRLELDPSPVSAFALIGLGLGLAVGVLGLLWRRFPSPASGSFDPRIGLQATAGSDEV